MARPRLPVCHTPRAWAARLPSSDVSIRKTWTVFFADLLVVGIGVRACGLTLVPSPLQRILRPFFARFRLPVVDLVAPSSGLESVVRLWSPRGEEGEVIGDDEAADPDPDSRSLEDIAQSNQGSMDSGETFSRATSASLRGWCYS